MCTCDKETYLPFYVAYPTLQSSPGRLHVLLIGERETEGWVTKGRDAAMCTKVREYEDRVHKRSNS